MLSYSLLGYQYGGEIRKRYRYFCLITEWPRRGYFTILLSFNYYQELFEDFTSVSVVKTHLVIQQTQVQPLIWGDPTCHKANKPVPHNNWACALESGSQLPAYCNSWSLSTLENALLNKRSQCNEKAVHHNWRVASTRHD